MSTQDNSKSSSSALQEQSSDSSSMVTSKQSPSLRVKRNHRWLASEERQRQFAKDFGPELILTLPGLSGPVVKLHKNADEGDK